MFLKIALLTTVPMSLALRLNDEGQMNPRTAVCTVGLVRELVQESVHQKLFKNLVMGIHGAGLSRTDGADLFMSLSLGDVPRAQIGVQNLLQTVEPVEYKLHDGWGQFQPSSQDPNLLVGDGSSCWGAGQCFYQGRNGTARASNFHTHISECFDLVAKHEQKSAQHYDVLLLTRADYSWLVPPLDVRNYNRTMVLHYWDHFFVAPRSSLDAFRSLGFQWTACRGKNRTKNRYLCDSEDVLFEHLSTHNLTLSEPLRHGDTSSFFTGGWCPTRARCDPEVRWESRIEPFGNMANWID